MGKCIVLYITSCPEVGQIPGPVDSGVSGVNKDLDNSSFLLLCSHQRGQQEHHTSLFPVAGYSPSLYLIGLSGVICLP